MLEVSVLGQFGVLLDGQPVTVPERPAQSLLAYLALNLGREHRREKLAGMLWPEASEGNARKYLRHALWRIRKSLKEPGADPDVFLHVNEISLAIKEDSPLWLDARELLQAKPDPGLPESKLMDVVALYRGELLPGFFDDWTVLERERIRAHFQRLMQELLDRLLIQERWQEVGEWGERWIALGDVPEPAFRAVMVAQAGAGDRSGAVATYWRAVADLERELGLEPSPSLRSTFDELAHLPARQVTRRDRLRDSTGGLRGELRPVTILHLHLTGTFPATADDLELLKDLLDQSMSGLVDQLLSFEGTIVRVENDGLLACFGAPVAHEDDTKRALMVALEIRERFSDSSPGALSLRVGIEAGELLIGELGWDMRLGYSAVGRAVDIAARLRSEARATEILVGEAAQDAEKGSFEFGPGRDFDVEGELVCAHPLLSVKGSVSPTITNGHIAALVGREEELATLLKKVDEGERGAVFVVGEPGIGKSRLIEEVRNRTRDARWGQGHCVSYGANMPYQPLIEAIASLIDQEDASDPAQTRQRLRRVLSQIPHDQRLGHESVIAGLLGLRGTEPTPQTLPHLDPSGLVDALYALVHEPERGRSVVLTFEDLHWADNGTITLIRQMLEDPEELPLLLILSMRPERETPAWSLREDVLASHASEIEEIHLEGLDESAMDDLLDSAGLPSPRMRDLLVRRSEGNPFFLEEMYRALKATTVQAPGAGHWSMDREPSQFDVPPTVQKVILARADRLAETERWVLQTASVLGWRFQQSILGAVSGVDTHQALKTLAETDFVRLKSLNPEPIYVFRHSLIGDAVYGTLLKSDRRRLHLRAGEALESLFEDRPDEQAGLLVHHYVLAGEAERAARFAPLMAKNAWSALAPQESARALELALEQDPPPDLALRLLVALARTRFSGADISSGIEAFDKAIRLARQIGDLSTMAECMADAAMNRWQATEARESRWAFLGSAVRDVADAPNSHGKLLLLQEAARQHLSAGDLDGAKRHLVAARRGLDALRSEHRAGVEAHLLNTEGLLALWEGQFETGLQLLGRALQLATESAALVATSRARTNLATALIDVYGRLDEGLEYIEETRETVVPRGSWAAFVEETVHLARIRWGEGGIGKGLAEIEVLAAALRGQPAWLSLSGAKAPLLSATGNTEQALSEAKDAWESAQLTGDKLHIGHAGLSMGRVLGYAGRTEQAQRFLKQAASAAGRAPALQSEILAEWIYAGMWSGPSAIIEAVRLLKETPGLSPYVDAWKRVGQGLASKTPQVLLSSADYFEGIGQEYLAWLYRFRAGRLGTSPESDHVLQLGESWAARKGLILY